MIDKFERGTPLGAILKKEEKTDALLPFMDKAERYKEDAERILHAEKLATLTRGFLTGCGGMRRVTEEKCEQFVKDHAKTVWRVMDRVPEEDRPAAVYALCLTLAQDREE